MSKAIKYSILAVFCFFTLLSSAQDTTNVIEGDTVSVKIPKKKNPKKAALFSAVIPGAGQFYNESYWKIPIIYAGLGTATYFIVTNRKEYLRYKRAFILDYKTDDFGQISEFNDGTLDQAQLNQLTALEREYADQYRSWMEYSYIAFIAVHVLQIIDATVDAHLFSFDVSDDLSMQVMPTMQYTAHRMPVTGLQLKFNF